jgi:hypothetical protein
MTANHFADRADRMHEWLLARCWGVPPPEIEAPRAGGTDAGGNIEVKGHADTTVYHRARQWISRRGVSA